jgi:hypothetical protein
MICGRLDGKNLPGDFSTWCARQLNRNRQSRFFKPEIEVIQPAGLNLDDDLIRAGLRPGQVAQFEFPRFAVGDELDGFHAGEGNA